MTTQNVRKPVTHRGGTFMTAFQLEGIIAAIRHSLACGQTPSAPTIQLLNRIRSDFQSAADGDPVERIPEIDESFSAADILIVAEMFHRTVMAFLTPEEAEDQKRIGFHANPPN